MLKSHVRKKEKGGWGAYIVSLPTKCLPESNCSISSSNTSMYSHSVHMTMMKSTFSIIPEEGEIHISILVRGGHNIVNCASVSKSQANGFVGWQNTLTNTTNNHLPNSQDASSFGTLRGGQPVIIQFWPVDILGKFQEVIAIVPTFRKKIFEY